MSALQYEPLPPAFLALLLAASPLLGSCASSGESKDDREPVPIKAWSPDMMKINGTSGIVLLEIDNSLKAWNQLLLTAKDEGDARTARALEEDLAYKASKHQSLLIEQLEGGSVTNRRVAALALGFTRGSVRLAAADRVSSLLRDPLPVLLAALEDPEPLVAANAAFAVGLLAAPDTPIAGLLEMLQFGEEPKARTNAAWALKELVDKGVDTLPMLGAAKAGLHDPEPGVRSTCALILAAGLDVSAIKDLALMLYDDENLPAVAAAQAIGYIGSRVKEAYGTSARALTAALPKARRQVRDRVLTVLQKMGERNYGPDNDEAWIEWAHSVP